MKCVRRGLTKEDIVGHRGSMQWIYVDKANGVVDLMINGDLISKKNKEPINMLYFKRDYIVVGRDLDMEEKKKIVEEKLSGNNLKLFYKTSDDRAYVEYMVDNVEITQEGIRINCK